MELRTRNIDRLIGDVSNAFVMFGDALSTIFCGVVESLDRTILIKYAIAEMNILSKSIIDDDCPWYDETISFEGVIVDEDNNDVF